MSPLAEQRANSKGLGACGAERPQPQSCLFSQQTRQAGASSTDDPLHYQYKVVWDAVISAMSLFPSTGSHKQLVFGLEPNPVSGALLSITKSQMCLLAGSPITHTHTHTHAQTRKKGEHTRQWSVTSVPVVSTQWGSFCLLPSTANIKKASPANPPINKPQKAKTLIRRKQRTESSECSYCVQNFFLWITVCQFFLIL